MAIKQNNGNQSPDGSTYVTLTDGAGILNILSTTAYPSGSVPVVASSGNVAASVASATLPAVVGKTNYISGFSISGSGSTVGVVVNATVAGLVGGVTLTYPVIAVAGVLLGNTPMQVIFNPALPANATNTAITVSCPSLGLGNTNNSVNIYGYQL